ncbi:unnamed protein product [Mytilus coruscus]|uniref:Uncharacterized protein n=1 Tax=Mytilus coruscus TaxID=42192 RepID=A0A6J8DDV3_MYTCO|nr:unnamed protein product [Mytilus coruscus]
MARRFKRTIKNKKVRHKLVENNNNKRSKLHTKLVKNAKLFVKNLSGHNLTDHETLLLAKGVKFKINPSNKNAIRNVMKDFDEFSRKLRCRYLFNDGRIYKIHPFYINSGYKPLDSGAAIENYIFSTKIELSRMKINKHTRNISAEELSAIRNLKKNNNIIIRKADKNSTLCILDKDNYLREGLRQLHNIHYEEIVESKVKEKMKKDNVKLYLLALAGRKWVQEGHITDCQAEHQLSLYTISDILFYYETCFQSDEFTQKEHEKNWTGSTKGMEPDLLKMGMVVKKKKEKNEIAGDDDSTGFERNNVKKNVKKICMQYKANIFSSLK